MLVREDVKHDMAERACSAGAAGGEDYLGFFGEALIGELGGGHVGVDDPMEEGGVFAATLALEWVAFAEVELGFFGGGDGLECHLGGWLAFWGRVRGWWSRGRRNLVKFFEDLGLGHCP